MNNNIIDLSSRLDEKNEQKRQEFYEILDSYSEAAFEDANCDFLITIAGRGNEEHQILSYKGGVTKDRLLMAQILLTRVMEEEMSMDPDITQREEYED